MTAALCLGIDSQPTRLGLAITRIEDRRPLWADTFKLAYPGRTKGQATRAAVRRASLEADRLEGDVVLIGMELALRPPGPTTKLLTIWQMGESYGLAKDAVERIFKGRHLDWQRKMAPATWRAAGLGPGHGHDSKDAVAVWVRRLCLELGWDEVQMNGLAEKDATDAVGVTLGAIARQEKGLT